MRVDVYQGELTGGVLRAVTKESHAGKVDGISLVLGRDTSNAVTFWGAAHQLRELFRQALAVVEEHFEEELNPRPPLTPADDVGN